MIIYSGTSYIQSLILIIPINKKKIQNLFTSLVFREIRTSACMQWNVRIFLQLVYGTEFLKTLNGTKFSNLTHISLSVIP